MKPLFTFIDHICSINGHISEVIQNVFTFKSLTDTASKPIGGKPLWSCMIECIGMTHASKGHGGYPYRIHQRTFGVVEDLINLVFENEANLKPALPWKIDFAIRCEDIVIPTRKFHLNVRRHGILIKRQ